MKTQWGSRSSAAIAITQEVPLYNTVYLLNPLFGFAPYSQQGFYDICPFIDGRGVSYPTNLIFKDNHIMPGSAKASAKASATAAQDILARAGLTPTLARSPGARR